MSHQVFREFEAYKDAHEDVDLRLTLSHPDRSWWSIRHRYVDSLHIQRGSDGCGDVAEGATRRDGWILYFQSGGIPQLANGVRLTRHSVLVAGPGAEFCLASQGCHDWTAIFFPTASLFPSSVDHQPHTQGGIRVVCPGRVQADRLQASLGRFMAAADADRCVTAEAASATSFREDLCRIAQGIIQQHAPPMESEGRSLDRRLLVSWAVEQIEQWSDMSPTVSALARRVGVSERTLRSALAEYLGMSPYQYLVVRRLNHARQLLLKSDRDELTVRQAAAKVGFWDFGRFARKYRNLFGELPSETLQRRRAGT